MKLQLVRSSAFAFLSLSLVACGGSGGGSTKPPSPGTTTYPRSTRTFATTFYPGLTVGAGFALDSASPGQSVPGIATDDNGSNLHGLSTNGTITTSNVREDQASSLSENGSSFDFGIEGRYLAFHGSVSGSHASLAKIASSDYSFTFYKNEDHGLFSPKFPAGAFQTLKDLYRRNPAQFARLYGSHYVSAVGLHRYVRATYYVSHVDTAKAASAGLSIDAGGQWIAAGFSASGDLSSFLKTLSSKMSVSVYIETNAQTVALDRTIRTPSDVDGVLAEIAAINYAGAKRVPYMYELTPWEDVFSGSSGSTDERQQLFEKIARDYYQVNSLAQSLEDVVTDSVRYDYLGSQVRNYYSTKSAAAIAERSRIAALLSAMKTNPSAGLNYTKTDLAVQFLVPGSVTFEPYLTNHHFLKISAHVKGALGTYRGLITDGTRKIFQNDIDTRDESTGTLPSQNVRYVRIEEEYPGNHPLWVPDASLPDGGYVSGSGWSFQLMDAQDRIVLSVPMPLR